MSDPLQCPQCSSENIYFDGTFWACPECSHEWMAPKEIPKEPDLNIQSPDSSVVRDSNGNELHDGDTVTVIKDLKIKGSSSVVKVGTKVKNIRLTDGDDGHDIACKIEGFGAMNLKSQFVKKI